MLKLSADIIYTIRRRGRAAGSKSTDVGWPRLLQPAVLYCTSVLSRLVSDCTVRRQYSALTLHYTAVLVQTYTARLSLTYTLFSQIHQQIPSFL